MTNEIDSFLGKCKYSKSAQEKDDLKRLVRVTQDPRVEHQPEAVDLWVPLTHLILERGSRAPPQACWQSKDTCPELLCSCLTPRRGGKMSSHAAGVPAAGGCQSSCHLDAADAFWEPQGRRFLDPRGGPPLPQGPGAWGRSGHLRPRTDSQGDTEAPTSMVLVIDTVARSYLLLTAELSLK